MPQQTNGRNNREEKKRDKLIEKAYYETCTGIEIDIMDIPKVFKFGHEVLKLSSDYENLKASIRNYVEGIRKN